MVFQNYYEKYILFQTIFFYFLYIVPFGSFYAQLIIV